MADVFICNTVMDVFFGPSENQKNDVSWWCEIQITWIFRFISWFILFSFSDYVASIHLSSTQWRIFEVNFIYLLNSNWFIELYFACQLNRSFCRQFLHYGEEIQLGYFGKYRDGSELRHGDFDLSKITTPISIHYSIYDRLADATDVEKLIHKLPNVVHVQRINELFNHVDFVWGIRSAKLIYSKISDTFLKYTWVFLISKIWPCNTNDEFYWTWYD